MQVSLTFVNSSSERSGEYESMKIEASYVCFFCMIVIGTKNCILYGDFISDTCIELKIFRKNCYVFL